MKLSLIIAIGLVFYIIDTSTGNADQLYLHCKDDKMFQTVLFCHHVINVYILFGWTSNDKTFLTIYVIFIICILGQWYLNKNKCFVTEYLSSKCKDKNYVFRNLVFYTGYKQESNTFFYYSYICFCLFYSIYKIKIYKSK